MMSGMLAALTSSAGAAARNPELREHCERLAVRLQDHYLRAMLTHLTVNDDWTEVLEEDSLPLRERLAIALQFLSDKELTAYLRRVLERCVHDGDIEGLLVSGLTPQGMEILQTYLDASGDIQTVALLASLNPARANERRTERWLDSYRDLLDEWKLFHHRCQFDIDRGRILNDAIQNGEVQPFRWTPPQMILRCNYCNKPLTPPLADNVKVRFHYRSFCSLLTASDPGYHMFALRPGASALFDLLDDFEHRTRHSAKFRANTCSCQRYVYVISSSPNPFQTFISFQTLLTTLSYSVNHVGTADMPPISWNGFMETKAGSRTRHALLPAVNVDVPMDFNLDLDIIVAAGHEPMIFKVWTARNTFCVFFCHLKVRLNNDGQFEPYVVYATV